MSVMDHPLLRDERVIGDFVNGLETGCTFEVGQVVQHPCGHSRVADLILPGGRREPRCSRHARSCESAIEEDPLEWVGFRVEFL